MVINSVGSSLGEFSRLALDIYISSHRSPEGMFDILVASADKLFLWTIIRLLSDTYTLRWIIRGTMEITLLRDSRFHHAPQGVLCYSFAI